MYNVHQDGMAMKDFVEQDLTKYEGAEYKFACHPGQVIHVQTLREIYIPLSPPPPEGIGTLYVHDQEICWRHVLFDTKNDKIAVAMLNLYGSFWRACTQ